MTVAKRGYLCEASSVIRSTGLGREAGLGREEERGRKKFGILRGELTPSHCPQLLAVLRQHCASCTLEEKSCNSVHLSQSMTDRSQKPTPMRF